MQIGILTKAYENSPKFSETNREGERENIVIFTKEVEVQFTLVKEGKIKILKTVKEICF